MDNEIAMKIYKRADEILLAACDSDILGKTFREGKLRIEVTPDFYDDTRVNKQIFIQNLRLCTISNLVGEKVVNYAIEAGFVNNECILWIDGVPHAQICTIT